MATDCIFRHYLLARKVGALIFPTNLTTEGLRQIELILNDGLATENSSLQLLVFIYKFYIL